ncbi:MAG: integrase arm-type DNA-binding domain-containing protein [Pseudomonadota bacterium]
MARQIGKLTAIEVAKKKESGVYADGGNLYLQVTKTASKSWLFRYMLAGKSREMGLGSVTDLSLSVAREKAAEYRKLVNEGIDPINNRKQDNAKKRLEEAKIITFKECGEKYIAAHSPTWRNAKHAWQWQNSLEKFVYSVFGDISVQDIDTNLVMKALEPIWKTKTETATRVRGRIEVILDWAKVREYRTGENPARWRGHLENLLPRPSKFQKIEHQPSLSYQKIGDFMQSLKKQEGMAALALQFTILTAARTSETICATWQEIDLQKKVWIVPANHTKAGREHRVPLSETAIAILHEAKKQNELLGYQSKNADSDFIFSGFKQGKHLSNTAMLMLLRRMKSDDITVHGFRSSFRNWAAEQTNYPREIAEAALSHTSGDKVEIAYLRSDFFEKRRQMMDAWSRYCHQLKNKGGNNILKIAERLAGAL